MTGLSRLGSHDVDALLDIKLSSSRPTVVHFIIMTHYHTYMSNFYIMCIKYFIIIKN